MRYVKIKVHIDSKERKIIKKGEDSFEIWTKEKARENKANKDIIFILSEYLKVSKEKIIIIKGQHSPSKIIMIYN